MTNKMAQTPEGVALRTHYEAMTLAEIFKEMTERSRVAVREEGMSPLYNRINDELGIACAVLEDRAKAAGFTNLDDYLVDHYGKQYAGMSQ